MSYDSRSVATLSDDFDLIEEGSGVSSVNSESHSLFSCVGVKAYSFFNRSKLTIDFPDSYTKVWNKVSGESNYRRIKALLIDYTKESCFFGSFIGRVMSGHWNRHHVSAVSKIIANMSVNDYYESTDEIILDLKILKPENGGSLSKRIKFIEMKLEEQLKYDFKF
ncbi:Dot/Icm secretion system substrate [Legionella steigerwaltii]|uniref:Dot/Icm secretion system substrate n=1 Tax=Legionella steigerwaltii TaxID=460 RepID=A0A378L5W4_9GAMM|nr:DUF5617 domain-containing protein [Legionella steigerwaltii]KTD78070.1 substrate of the Dot/Icm secretion system [Legionella steigerwaltii]STY22193.1 Dot/Icm secretion system substrate [Legionella steigerwaltii]